MNPFSIPGRSIALALVLAAQTLAAGAQSRDRAQTPDKY
jgi:hypothetical protein